MEFLKELCSVNAVSGNEKNMTGFLCDKLKNACDDIYADNDGNVIASINNSGKTILLDAHIDQIGLVVKSIDENGFIHFINSGGIDPSVLSTAEVIVHGKKDVYGVIGAKPLHLMKDDESNSNTIMENMYVDCGFSKEKAEKFINVGDTISLCSEFSVLKNDNFTSKSLDNRIGVYVVAQCLKRLYGKNTDYNIKALFSVREELGLRGASKAAEIIKPDYAIIIDVTFGINPYTDSENGFKVGGGITVAVGPNLDKESSDKIILLCKKNNINVTKEVCAANPGTNSWTIQTSGNGVKCVLISVPIKYMHTTVETGCLNDVKNAIDIICMAIDGGVF